jgi:CRISPR/Cas system-associated exonuclease Cas4 (RecB family)
MLLGQEEKAVDFITKLAETEIAKYEKEMPVASEYYTERQKRDIIDDCIRFAQDEVNTEEKFIPLYMEHEFGKDGSCEIRLEDDRTFKVYGLIDRIDKLESTGEYRIIDYKSGKSLMYLGVKDPEDGLPNEASIQPILYYLALMETARNSSDPALSSITKVREASYRFVTSKGDYDTISLAFDDDSEKRFKSAFSCLFDQMSAGQFTPTGAGMSPPDVEDSDNGPDCKFCGYVDACKFSALDGE